jgi:hypothetical protein
VRRAIVFVQVETDREDMGDALPSATAPSSGQAGWEWNADTQKWVASSGKPLFRVVPDDTKPTLRDPVSTTSKSPLEC